LKSMVKVMVKTNGKSQVDPQELDLDHELPASDETDPVGVAPTRDREDVAPQSEIQKLKAERDALVDRLARLQADFENARKRAAKEQQDFREYAAADAIKALPPALDSFERAIHLPDSHLNELRNGVELIYKQLHDALAKLGVQPVPSKGETFDPRVHEAIEMVETDKAPDHQVVEELQRGYKLKDRLLRPAMVKVANNPKH
jgi:molecular chaperone GrpE